jgi:hypothetical protein
MEVLFERLLSKDIRQNHECSKRNTNGVQKVKAIPVGVRQAAHLRLVSTIKLSWQINNFAAAREPNNNMDSGAISQSTVTQIGCWLCARCHGPLPTEHDMII